MFRKSKILIVILVLSLSSIMCVREEIDGFQETIDIFGSSPIIRMQEIKGDVKLKESNTSDVISPVAGLILQPGNQIYTLENSSAEISFSNGTIIKLSPLSSFTLVDKKVSIGKGMYAKLHLSTGQIWIYLNDGQIDVETPAGLTSLTGSYMNIQVNSHLDETLISCFNGNCEFVNERGEMVLNAGENVIISGVTIPRDPSFITEDEIQSWVNTFPAAKMVVDNIEMIATYTRTPKPPTPTFTPTPLLTATP